MAPTTIPTRLIKSLAPLLVVLAIYGLWSILTPTPFSYKGDMYILAAPMARFIGASWLSGHIPAISWLMGDGFNPWLSGQSGVLYPVYPVAMLLAKLLRREFLLLELTALLDFALVAYFIYGSPLFRKSSSLFRLALAALFVAQPAAAILGQNWCYFLNSYTWCLISMGNLLAWRRWPVKTRYGWWTLASLLILFTAINAQMFPFFIVLCILPVLLSAGWRHWRRQVSFGLLLGVLLIPPFLAIWWASQNGNPAWMAGRDSADAPLAFGQTLPTVLKGAILGNLAGNGFQIWRGVSAWGSGIFFVAPAALLGLVLARPRDRRFWLLTGGAILLLMGIATLPFLKWLFVGPFARFRWTWKFAIFVPAVVLGCIGAGRPERRPRTWMSIILISAGMSLWIASRGMMVDFFPSQVPVRQWGVRGLLDPATELRTRLALKPNERLVPVGRMTGMDRPTPAAWLAMIGNAPSLVDIPSMALYDPLEPAESAKFRGGLSTPWREALPDDMDMDQFDRVDQYLGPRGAALYLFKVRPAFQVPASEEVHLSNGDVLWTVRSRHWRPWAMLASGRPAPEPTLWGDWPVPEADQIRLATARELTLFPDPGPSPEARRAMHAHPDGFHGPWVLRFHPLGEFGPWIGVWYVTAALLFLMAWWKQPPLTSALGLPSPAGLSASLQRIPWMGLICGMAGLFLALRLPYLLRPQPISDAVMAYPREIMVMVAQHLAPYRQMPFEYPPLALVPLGLAALAAKGSVWLFRLGFAFQMFLVDGLLFAAVVGSARRFASRAPGRNIALPLGAGLLYLAATQPLGCLLYDRMDLAVAAFMALPFLLRFSGIPLRPWQAGGILALGFWFKLVPVLALFPLAIWEWQVESTGHAWKRPVQVAGWTATGILALGAVALALFGPSLWGFFRYHLARPIEISTLWGSLDYLLSGGSIRPLFGFGSWNLSTGPLGFWKLLSTACTAAGMASTLILGVRAIGKVPPVRLSALVALGMLLSFIGFGKVFSPQYLLWAAPLLPLLVWEENRSDRLLLILGGSLGAILVTGLFFPDWHYALVQGEAAIWLLVLLRNALCIATLLGAWGCLFRPEPAP